MTTRWNGEECTAVRGTAVVRDSGFFPQYWAREYVGQRRACVMVVYVGQTFFLDDADGSGWTKVTSGGSPHTGHRDLEIQAGSFEVNT